MFDYYLSFNSEEEAKKVLNDYVKDTINYAVDFIGIMYKQVDTGTVDKEGIPIYEQEVLDGYKVNLRSRKELDLKDYQVFPETPGRVFS